jgi:Glycosyl transferase family 2
MPAPIQINFVYDKGSVETELVVTRMEGVLKDLKKDLPAFSKVRHLDVREPPVFADVNIHILVPVFGYVPWAHANVIIKNPDAWASEWNPYLSSFDGTFDLKDLGLREEILKGLTTLFGLATSCRPTQGVMHCPPILTVQDCPPISIVTPTYNRRTLIDIAFHNLLATDYPKKMIEWIVVEDNEDSTLMASEKIMNFQVNNPEIQVKYIPIQGRMTIGQKRNIGVEHCTNEIVLFMDDDDHYPVTSFRRRVAWLTKRYADEYKIAFCTTIALYDLNRGVSAVNVPPYGLGLGKRISEATLTFRKSAWIERKFDDVSVAEGENWITGRESSCIELPPQQIIVAFSHGGNKSSRRIPPIDVKEVACFWGFPKEYLVFIHGLAGVEIENAAASSSKKKV